LNTLTTYEFPLNERIRVFMRLEQLFNQLSHFMSGTTVYDRRAAIETLLDIVMIFGRSDLKSELIKELERRTQLFKRLSNSQTADNEKLEESLERLAQSSRKLYGSSGKIGINVMESDLFQSFSQRSSIPGGSCCFDLPALHYWLEQDSLRQQIDLDRWTQPFADIRVAIDLILSYTRQGGSATQEIAKSGFFQLALEKSQNQPVQLLRIALDPALHYFAEISGGKHRFSIRFMVPSDDETRPGQTNNDVSFYLTRCAF
jgi:cell division protein ZapD